MLLNRQESPACDAEVIRPAHVLRALQRFIYAGPVAWPFTGTDGQNFNIQVADTPELRARCYRLGQRVYRRMGMAAGSEEDLLVSRYDARPDTFPLLITDAAGREAATLTLVFDSDADGLPLDCLYQSEADRLRARGRRTAEIIRLAADEDVRRHKEVLVHLFNFAFIYARHVKNCDDLLINVTPRHASYYKRLLHFEQIGEEKACPRVEGTHGVMLRLSLTHVEECVRRAAADSADASVARSLYACAYPPEAEPFIAAFLERRQRPMTEGEIVRYGLRRMPSAY